MRLVMKSAQVTGDGFTQPADTVLRAEAVGIVMKGAATGDAQFLCHRQRRPAQRAFGNDVGDVGPVKRPQTQQGLLGGQT